MPYSSDAQRKWAHTSSGLKALGGEKGVNEWDRASKGKKLPEHVKMANGGIVEQIKQYLKEKYTGATPGFQTTLGDETKGLQMLANDKAGIPRPPVPALPTPPVQENYAFGGLPGQPKFDPMAGLPPAAPMLPLPQMPIPAPQQPLQPPQMPPQGPSPANPYIAAQKAQIGRYGPEEQLAVANDIVKRRGSMGRVIPQAMGGLADAIMQGVARAGPSSFQSNITNQQDARDKVQMDALEKAGTQNIARTEANMKMDTMDPKSELSQIAQQAWGPLLAQNGFKPEQVRQMNAASIAAITGQSVESLKAKAEAQMAAATLGLKTGQAAQEVKHQTAEELARTEGQKLEAAKGLQARPWYQKAAELVLPDSSATKIMREQAGEGSPAGVPALGQIEDGHKFKGGNPADPASWEPI